MRLKLNQSGGLGRMGGLALGPGGECVCPKCGATTEHDTADPCYKLKCPKCGATMTRQKGSAGSHV